MKTKHFAYPLALGALLAASAVAQTPTVGGLLNNYSFTLPGLPNYGIAQGSIFDIFGTNLASVTTALQNPPLQTSLDGVSIDVTVNGTTTHPPIYFLSSGQIVAILPSATPVGSGTLTVTTAGGTSVPFAIQVVKSAFGLLTNNNGSGPVAGYNASNNYASMSYTSATNPGDILELWGTGLGPVSDDAVSVEVSAPIEVDIGGMPAPVLYHGRSGYAGLDQINVQVPSGVSGCNVSVVVVTGNYVSNFATLPVAASGRVCSDPDTGLTSDLLSSITKQGSFTSGYISISKTTTPGMTVGGVTIPGQTTDSGLASFQKITTSQLSLSGYGSASMGSCSVMTFAGQTPPVTVTTTSLNAGPAVNMTGPEGAVAMPLQTVNNMFFYSTPENTSFIPSSGGTYHFDNGAGGPDVGAFTAELIMPAPLVWTNMSSITTVNRSAGVTVNWTGGDPATLAIISGTSVETLDGDAGQALAGFFTCTAPVAAGAFTVPPSVLLALPPSSTIEGVSFSSLSVGNSTKTTYFNAPNVDVAGASATVSSSTYVTYQ